MFSSYPDFGGLEQGSSRKSRPTTYEQRRDEILKKNKALKRLRDRLTPEELAEIEQRERPFFNDLIKKSRGPPPTDFSLAKFVDPFGFLTKKQGDKTEAQITKSSFSLTNDTYAGPAYTGLKHGDAKFIPTRKDFAVLTPNSTSHASRIHDLYFTLIGAVKDPGKRERLRKLANQYYSAQLSSGLKNRGKERKDLLGLYLDHMRTYPDEDFSSFFQRNVHDDPQLTYHVAAAMRNPDILAEEQKLRTLYRQMKSKKGVSRQQFEDQFKALSDKVEGYLATVKRPDKVEAGQDPNQLAQVFYGDKSYSGLIDHDNLDVVFSAVMKSTDEALYTDDVEGIELAAKAIFERNKGNTIDYLGMTREQTMELLDVLKNEGDNRLYRELTEAITADLDSDPLPTEEKIDQETTAPTEDVVPENVESAVDPVEATEEDEQEIMEENVQPEKIQFQEQVKKEENAEEEENQIEMLVDINLAQGDTSSDGEPSLARLQNLYTSGVIDQEGLRSYLGRQSLSSLQRMLRK